MTTTRSNHARCGSRRPALTLVELLIVVTVIAIIGLLALPRAGQIDLLRVRNAARLLVADLEHAQVRSIGDGADPCVVVFDEAGNQYWIARSSDPGTPIVDPGTGQPYRTSFGRARGAALDGVLLASIDVGGDDQLAFTALGATDEGTDALIVLRSGGATTRIVIDAVTGEPRVE